MFTHVYFCIIHQDFRTPANLNRCRQLLTEDTGEETVQRPVVTQSHTHYHTNLVCPQTIPPALKDSQHLLNFMNSGKATQTVMEGKTIIFQHAIHSNSNFTSKLFLFIYFTQLLYRFQKDKSSKRRQNQANLHDLEITNHILKAVSESPTEKPEVSRSLQSLSVLIPPPQPSPTPTPLSLVNPGTPAYFLREACEPTCLSISVHWESTVHGSCS